MNLAIMAVVKTTLRTTRSRCRLRTETQETWANLEMVNDVLMFKALSTSKEIFTITPKRVASCGNHLRGLAPGQHISQETSQWCMASRWRQFVRLDRTRNRTLNPPHFDHYANRFGNKQSAYQKTLQEPCILIVPRRH